MYYRKKLKRPNPYKEVNELIMGWQIALTRMPEGDKWEVYIPAKWAYGAMKMDDIPAYSTLIFTMPLVKIER